MDSKQRSTVVRVTSSDQEQDMRIAGLLEDVDCLRERMEKLEKWQAFVLGVVATVSALAGLTLGIFGLLK